MKRIATRTFWTGIVVALLCLTIRLLWVVSQTETGLQTLALEWRDATYGLLAGNRTPVPMRGPADQAEVLLREVDRILESNANDAQVVMGAALVLDSPSPDYAGSYLKKNASFPGVGVVPELNRYGLQKAEDVFESRCRDKCLELTARATQLDPANVQWWRLRALLLWRYSMHASDGRPRTENWADILNECAKHDPENALYDYIATHFYWESSADLNVVQGKIKLEVIDAHGFARGTSCFERGQNKPFFNADGDASFSATAALQHHSTIPLMDQARIVNSRTIFARRSTLLQSLYSWQEQRADEAVAANNIDAALEIAHQTLHMIDQYTGVGTSTACDNVAVICNVLAARRLHTLAQSHKELFSANELQQLDALLEEMWLREMVIRQAAQNLAKNKPRRQAGLVSVQLSGDFATILSAVITGIAAPLVVILLLVGFLAIALSCFTEHRDCPMIGVIGQFLSLGAACAVTILFLGLAPAGIISDAVESWTLTILIIVVPLALTSWFVQHQVRRRAFQFSLRTILISIFLLCFLLGILSMAGFSMEPFTKIPFDLSIPPRDLGGFDAASLQRVVYSQAEWLWVILQWTAYHGRSLTLALWGGFSALLLFFMLTRTSPGPGNVAPAPRNCVGAWARSFGRASLSLSVLIMIIYLALMPNVIRNTEKDFHDKMAFARHPKDYWANVERAVQKVQDASKTVKQLRAQAQAEMVETEEARSSD